MAGGGVGPSLMDTLFQRSLEDLIKGLRLHHSGGGGGEPTFISKSVEEIRREIKSNDPQTKSTALQKLTYLHSLYGLDMSWAAFHAIEVISSHSFHHKRIGYLAASLSFNAATDVLLLLTHQFRKDLSSANPHEVSLALECISIICTPDLARDLTPEIFTLLGSSKQLVKKKAVATVLRVFEQYPDAVRVCFKRLVENLEISDITIVSAVVGVFCELANREPGSYLPLAPEFYRILVDSRNNWVLIKVLKIFAKLVPLEPRLVNKVVEPICDHLRRSGAKSLVFECVRTIASSFSDHESAVKLAVGRIRDFLTDDDSNLKYLGLQALSIVAPKHLWAVLENKEIVIKSLSDDDPNIKLEALRLVMTMVSEDNLAEICRVLINYALKSEPEFCNEILGSILSNCSRNFYEMVIDFDWYVKLLGEIARIPHCQKGEEIGNQLVDIGMRVKDVRPELVCVGRDFLIDPAFLGNPFIHSILSAAAWVSGEYVEFSTSPCELMEALLQPRTSLLPSSIRAVYVQAAFKVWTFCLYSYLFPGEAFLDDLGPGAMGSMATRKYPETSGLVCTKHLPDCAPDEGFNPGVNAGNSFATHEQASSSASQEKFVITQESIATLGRLIETTLGPLAGSHEVELLERVRNVFGLIELIKQDIPGFPVLHKWSIEGEESFAFTAIKLIRDAFSEELGPVSVSAQERVPKPAELIFKESLNDLDEICGDIQLPISCSFSLERPDSGERDGMSSISRQNKDESETLTESTSLLAEHRKRHVLYYLPSDEKEVISNDYPPANEPKLDNAQDEDAVLIKLAEKSLALERKPSKSKPRPVVVKLEEGDGFSAALVKPKAKDDLLSGAVRDVLSGNEAKSSSSKSRGKEKSSIDPTSQGISELKNSTSRSKHSKERKHRSRGQNDEERGGNSQKDKRKSSHRHGRHKAQHQADGSVNAVSAAPVIPDFLL